MQRKTSHTRVKNEGKKRFFFRWEKKRERENENLRQSILNFSFLLDMCLVN